MGSGASSKGQHVSECHFFLKLHNIPSYRPHFVYGLITWAFGFPRAGFRQQCCCERFRANLCGAPAFASPGRVRGEESWGHMVMPRSTFQGAPRWFCLSRSPSTVTELALPTPSLAPPFRVWMAALRVGVSWCLPVGFIRVSPIPGTQGSLPHTYWPFTELLWGAFHFDRPRTMARVTSGSVASLESTETYKRRK